MDAYDEVLYCLAQAHEHLINALKFSNADVSTRKRPVSIGKHVCLEKAEPYLAEARNILEQLECQVKDTISIQNTRLNLGKVNAFHDVYGDGLLTDFVVHLRIQKMVKAVEAAHKEIKKLKAKL